MLLKIEKITQDDQRAVLDIVKHFWGDAMVVIHGTVFHTPDLQGLKAVIEGEIVGILHYQVNAKICQIITLASLYPGQGIGSCLLAAVESHAAEHQCQKLSLITTNDNLNALGFYQRRGYQLVELHPGQVAISRQIKPSIPLVGENKIPLRDELKLEKRI
jgi:N-acetylglutamate synthase-like GNAT family acetyltransferase